MRTRYTVVNRARTRHFVTTRSLRRAIRVAVKHRHLTVSDIDIVEVVVDGRRSKDPLNDATPITSTRTVATLRSDARWKAKLPPAEDE